MPADLPQTSRQRSFIAVIVAGGVGQRAGQGQPKQYAQWRGRPMLLAAAQNLVATGARRMVVAVPAGDEGRVSDMLQGLTQLAVVVGGETRQASVRNALASLADEPGDAIVLIHDAARPDVPAQVVMRLVKALEDAEGSVPVLPLVDSALETDAEFRFMAQPADRDRLRRVQTPQAFRLDAIRAAQAAWPGPASAGDDAQVLRAAGGQVALVDGDVRLAKLTVPEDFMMPAPPVRIGTGFDVHRLAEGEELWLAGIQVPHDRGLAGHSDADVVLHALVDALLGAIGQGDIGSHFPPSDPQWRGARSARFVEHAVNLVTEAGYRIGNVDLTIICEAPKIGPHRDAMRARIAELLAVDIGQVSVKATTTERLGFTGRGEGIAAQAAATLYMEG